MAVVPKTGAVKFSDFNTCIFNRSSTATIKMSDAGKRIGYAGISGGSVTATNLRGCWGYEITTGYYNTGGKFPVVYSGYRKLNDAFDIGSISPVTVSGSQTCNGSFSTLSSGVSNTYIYFGGTIDAEFEPADANRFGYDEDALAYSPFNANTNMFEVDLGSGSVFPGDGSKVNCCIRFG